MTDEMNIPDEQICPIWGTPAKVFYKPKDWFMVESARAGGTYWIRSKGGDAFWKNLTTLHNLPNPEDLKIKITDWIIENQHPESEKYPSVLPGGIEKIAKRQLSNPIQQCEDLLKKLVEYFPRIGAIVHISGGLQDNLMAHSHCSGEEDLNSLLRELAERDWIKSCGENNEFSQQHIIKFSITIEGRKFVEGLSKNRESTQAFIAMWFGDAMDEVYENGIKSALDEMGYTPNRIDKKPHNKKICDEIIADIRKSRFIIADFTCPPIKETDLFNIRGGVYFEAGFAMGLGIPVIWSCRKDAIDSLHFDTRQYNHIIWEDVADLKKQLMERIGANIT